MTQDNEPQEIEVTDAAAPETVEVSLEEPGQEPEQPEAQQEPAKPFNPKTDKVEFDKPEQQERFNEVYRQLKKSDQRNAMLTDFLQNAVKELEEVRGFTNELKTEKATQQEQEAENVLVQKLRNAHEEGDNETFVKTLKELQTFGVRREAEKIFDQKVNELTNQERQTEQKQAEFVAQAMKERAPDGSFIRPWLQEEDPRFGQTLYQIQRIAKKYENDPDILVKTLKDLDQVMGGQMKEEEPPKTTQNPQSRAPNPMQGSNLTNHKPKGTIKMTRAEADILKKLERHSGKKIDLKKYEARRTAMYDGQSKGGR